MPMLMPLPPILPIRRHDIEMITAMLAYAFQIFTAAIDDTTPSTATFAMIIRLRCHAAITMPAADYCHFRLMLPSPLRFADAMLTPPLADCHFSPPCMLMITPLLPRYAATLILRCHIAYAITMPAAFCYADVYAITLRLRDFADLIRRDDADADAAPRRLYAATPLLIFRRRRHAQPLMMLRHYYCHVDTPCR